MTELLTERVPIVGEALNDTSRSLHDRFRALFTLRNIGGEDAINYIAECFMDNSVLLKHELAYCLGQMQDIRALPVLERVLNDLKEDPMVRHEAGEAIGAIGDSNSIKVLEKFVDDPVQVVAETCHLAIKRINSAVNKDGQFKSQYNSVDPAPAFSQSLDVQLLRKQLLNEEEDLFNRYKAMFALRNLNTPESIQALCEGLFVGSALFRHEIAFVLGQLQSERSVDSLERVLRDPKQSEMVRHEAAEALGSIATPHCDQLLREFLSDSSTVVSESCQVALDMAKYENSDEFQYANAATTVK